MADHLSSSGSQSESDVQGVSGSHHDRLQTRVWDHPAILEDEALGNYVSSRVRRHLVSAGHSPDHMIAIGNETIPLHVYITRGLLKRMNVQNGDLASIDFKHSDITALVERLMYNEHSLLGEDGFEELSDDIDNKVVPSHGIPVANLLDSLPEDPEGQDVNETIFLREYVTFKVYQVMVQQLQENGLTEEAEYLMTDEADELPEGGAALLELAKDEPELLEGVLDETETMDDLETTIRLTKIVTAVDGIVRSHCGNILEHVKTKGEVVVELSRIEKDVRGIVLDVLGDEGTN